MSKNIQQKFNLSPKGKKSKLRIKDYCQQLLLYLILESQNITIKGMVMLSPLFRGSRQCNNEEKKGGRV